MRSPEIYNSPQLRGEDKKVVGNRIWIMKKRGLIADEKGLLTATSKGREFLQKQGPIDDVGGADQPDTRPAKVKPNGHAPRKPTVTPATKDKSVRDLLDRAARQAQDMLDEYVAMIADPTVLDPLRIARDQTRMALAAWDKDQS
jgi:hypothetical protein